MNYTDVLFLVLLALVCVLCRALRPWPSIREWAIIAFSLLVIASWGIFSLAIFLAVAAINFAAVAAACAGTAAPRRVILLATVVFDVATLAFFKYAGFLAASLGTAFGANLTFPTLGLPLAISFYTFQSISYVVDCLRERTRPLGLRKYLFYQCFFPHFMAGPILRVWQLPSQLGRVRIVRSDMLFGIHYVVVGFFLKAVVADNLADALDPIWAGGPGTSLSAADHWVMAFLYYCQIYSDFAGYSLMALGMARLVAYRLPANFRTPMLAGTMQEFWRRWHITLSRWLRDYLYIPLGGNRLGKSRAELNILITMLLGGLWHGAAWTYVAWGAMHGLGLASERLLGFQKKPPRFWQRIPWWLVTQLWVTMAWVFFRSADMPQALDFIRAMFRWGHWQAFDVQARVAFPLLIAGGAVLHHLTPLGIATIPRRHLGWCLGVATGVLLVLDIVVYSPSNVFIYFKF